MNEDIKNKAREEKANDERRKAYEWTKDERWIAIKRLLVKRLMEIDSCSLIAEALPDIKQAGEMALVNGKVVKVISGWIADIEGEADLYLQLIEAIKEEKIKSDNLIFKVEEE